MIAQTRALLRNRMDRLVSSLIVEHGEFVAGYRAARVVVHRAGTSPGEMEEEPATAPAAPPAPAAIARWRGGPLTLRG